MSFENSSQILEFSSTSCSVTPLLIDYGLEASKLTERLRRMRPSIVLYNLLGVDKKNMKSFLHDISNELHEYIKDTGQPMLTKKSKNKIKELKNVEEHIFHPGGNSTIIVA